MCASFKNSSSCNCAYFGNSNVSESSLSSSSWNIFRTVTVSTIIPMTEATITTYETVSSWRKKAFNKYLNKQLELTVSFGFVPILRQRVVGNYSFGSCRDDCSSRSRCHCRRIRHLTILQTEINALFSFLQSETPPRPTSSNPNICKNIWRSWRYFGRLCSRSATRCGTPDTENTNLKCVRASESSHVRCAIRRFILR